MQDSLWGLTKAEGQNPLPRPVPTLLGMQPRIRLACWAASTHCWVMLRFWLTNTSMFFSSGVLSIYSLPSLYLCLRLPWPMCSTLCLVLLNFMRFTQAHLSSLSRSLWMTSHSSSRCTTLVPTVHDTNKQCLSQYLEILKHMQNPKAVMLVNRSTVSVLAAASVISLLSLCILN